MSPYQRAVTDIEKRESQRAFESQIMPQFEKQAVQAGGMSGLGTRAGVQASELGRAQMQRLGDIEAKGLQAAYRDAQNLFTAAASKEKEQAAADIAGLAPAMVAGGVTEQGLLQSIGEEKQALGQQALNEAYFRHLEEQAFPQEQLAGYSGFVYGNPLMQQRTMTQTSPAAMGPSKGAQLMGLGMTAAKMYGMGGGFVVLVVPLVGEANDAQSLQVKLVEDFQEKLEVVYLLFRLCIDSLRVQYLMRVKLPISCHYQKKQLFLLLLLLLLHFRSSRSSYYSTGSLAVQHQDVSCRI